MLTRMSDSSSRDLREPASAEGSGILAGLPRTRPQRASARRTAARAASRKTRGGVRVADNGSARERAPRQGFEAEPDSLGPVQPPGSAELISSAAELAGELAKAGVDTGARVLKDFLSRLPG